MSRSSGFTRGRRPDDSGNTGGVTTRGSIPTTDGVTPRGVIPTLVSKTRGQALFDDIARNSTQALNGEQNEYGLTYVNLLEQLKQMNEQGYTVDQMLRQLSVYGDAMNGPQVDDWNKQLLDTQLNLALTRENRGYNESLRDEQRLYDNPLNQLARLMGAGISRDAAIQMLSGGSGGSGSGVPYSDPAALPQSAIPASQSTLNGAQAFQAHINGVFGPIGSIAGAIGALGQFGMSAASLGVNLAATKAATAGQVLSNTQFSKTLQGIETASTVVGAISSAVDAGIIAKDHVFDSSQDMLQTIRHKADSFEPFNALVSTGALDKISKDVYSLNALNGAYKSWRESRDYGVDRGHIVRQYALQEMFGAIDIERVNSEIQVNYQQINESIASVINSTNLANSQVILNESLRVKAYAETSNIDSLTDLNKQQYDLNQYDLDWLSANIADINSIRTNQLMLDAACWEQAATPYEKSEFIKSWLKNRENQRTAIALESYYLSSKLTAQQFANGEVPSPITGGTGNTGLEQTAKLAVWWHNLTATSLQEYSSASDDAKLGALRGSAVAGYLIKVAKYAL